MDDREKAKAIICEILHQSGGKLSGKVRLYKAFYHASLRYAEMKREWLEELTEWPMARMPNGPGIDKGSELLEELEQEKYIKISRQQMGSYTEYRYEELKVHLHPLNADEKMAIKYGVETIGSHTGSKLSRWSHEFCNTWKHFKDGEQINIHHDLMTEKEFLGMREANKWADQALREIFSDDAP